MTPGGGGRGEERTAACGRLGARGRGRRARSVVPGLSLCDAPSCDPHAVAGGRCFVIVLEIHSLMLPPSPALRAYPPPPAPAPAPPPERPPAARASEVRKELLVQAL
jgi:hypothetical protein